MEQADVRRVAQGRLFVGEVYRDQRGVAVDQRVEEEQRERLVSRRYVNNKRF